MNRALILNRNLLAFGIPLSLFAVLIFIMKSSFLAENDSLNLAITADLLLIVPLIYFLLIRKTGIPKTTVVPVMIIGVLIGSYFLPKDSQTYLELFKIWALPVIELSIITFVVIKMRSAIKKYKSLKGYNPDFFTTLKRATSEILPKRLVHPFATEIAVFYYGFFNWSAYSIKKDEFTYHKESGTRVLFAVLLLIIGAETVALHFLLIQWSNVAAWILSGISAYTAIQVFGFSRSLAQRPISVNENSLTLRYGIMNEVEIDLDDIETIELSKKPLADDTSSCTLSPLGELESHNMILYLKTEHELVGIYGIRKRFKVLGFYVDKPEDFLSRVEDYRQQSIR